MTPDRLAEIRDRALQNLEERDPKVCECPALVADHWFDRSICPEPCGMMHDRCSTCLRVVGRACLIDIQPRTHMPVDIEELLEIIDLAQRSDTTS